MGSFIKGDVVIIPFPFPFALPIDTHDFVSGGLPIDSFIRPNKIFTADKKIILSIAGKLNNTKVREVVNSIITLVSA